MGGHVNVKRDESGKEVREKRTRQYSREELEDAIRLYGNDKKMMAEYLHLGQWSLREQLKRAGLNIDKRIEANKKKAPPIAHRDDLWKYYYEDNLTLLDISKIYGVSNVTIRSWFEKLNIPVLSVSETIKQKVTPKIINKNIEKYGVEYFYQTDEFKEKSRETCLERYGTDRYYIGNSSKAELEVLDFFNSFLPGFEKSHEFGIELDGYNKEYQVAFEYCGLYYHRESYKGKKLHIDKYKVCREFGIRLFTIFEDEWVLRKDQVKQFIKSSLNVDMVKIFARKLTFHKFDGNDERCYTFIDQHHIQGVPAKGLVQNFYTLLLGDEIYALITISRHHRNSHELVLSRYCVKDNYKILGGSVRLLSHIRKDFPGILLKSWSDNRWTLGTLYQTLGFTLVREEYQDYSYVSINGKVSRRSKQSMKKGNIGATEGQTEYERALELGYDRIWDCGKKTWVMRL